MLAPPFYLVSILDTTNDEDASDKITTIAIDIHSFNEHKRLQTTTDPTEQRKFGVSNNYHWDESWDEQIETFYLYDTDQINTGNTIAWLNKHAPITRRRKKRRQKSRTTLVMIIYLYYLKKWQ